MHRWLRRDGRLCIHFALADLRLKLTLWRTTSDTAELKATVDCFLFKRNRSNLVALSGQVWYENPPGMIIRPGNSKHRDRWSG